MGNHKGRPRAVPCLRRPVPAQAGGHVGLDIRRVMPGTCPCAGRGTCLLHGGYPYQLGDEPKSKEE